MAEPMGALFWYDWEMRFMEWLQALIGGSGIDLWIISNLSAFGEQIVLVFIMGFLYWGLNKEFGKYVGLNVLVINVWNPLVKNVVRRLRPYFVPGYDVDLLRLIDTEADAMDVAAQGYSFPSGHAGNAVAVYGSLAVHEKNKRLLWVLAFVLPLLVGFSRVAVGAHFPTDVIFGWVLGVLVILLIPWLQRKIQNRWLFSGVILLTGIPGFFYCTSNDYYSSFGMLFGFLLAVPFEEKFVKFENTTNLFQCSVRTLTGGALFLGLNSVLKLPFSDEVLNAGDLTAHLIRSGRYAVVIFVLIGIYPMIFKVADRFLGWGSERKEK